MLEAFAHCTAATEQISKALKGLSSQEQKLSLSVWPLAPKGLGCWDCPGCCSQDASRLCFEHCRCRLCRVRT